MRQRHAKTLTFSNISVITEDIYLKLKSSCSLSKGELIPVGEVIRQFFFGQSPAPFFDFEFSKCSYSRALAPACGAHVLMFIEM